MSRTQAAPRASFAFAGISARSNTVAAARAVVEQQISTQLNRLFHGPIVILTDSKYVGIVCGGRYGIEYQIHAPGRVLPITFQSRGEDFSIVEGECRAHLAQILDSENHPARGLDLLPATKWPDKRDDHRRLLAYSDAHAAASPELRARAHLGPVAEFESLIAEKLALIPQ